MLKKIVLGTLFTGLIGALMAGAVIRTSDRLGQPLDSSGEGRGRNAQAEVGEGSRGEGRNDGNGGNGQGDGSGSGQGSGQGQNSGGGQGSGQGGNAQYGGSQGYSEGESRQGSGSSGQGSSGNGQQGSSGNGLGDGTGLEDDEDWLTLEGMVVTVDEDALIVEVADGELLIEGRAWLYALEEGFTTEAGREVTVTGFWEDGEFKPVELVDVISGASIVVRDEGGRPYWAGQGRGAGS